VNFRFVTPCDLVYGYHRLGGMYGHQLKVTKDTFYVSPNVANHLQDLHGIIIQKVTVLFLEYFSQFTIFSLRVYSNVNHRP
jgi:hypothetical protein